MAGNGKSRFKSLRARHDKDATDSMVLFENVPPHLFAPLSQWCDDAFWNNDLGGASAQERAVGDMCIDLHLEPPIPFMYPLAESLCKRDPDRLLDIVDWILHPENRQRMASEYDRSQYDIACNRLEDVLFRSGSAWQVDDPPNQLIKRIPKELDTEFQQATIQNDPISEHLRDAWDAAWRHDDPSEVEAYNSAVKALEASLAPIVIPKSSTATLGTIISALKSKPKKWDTRFRGEETVQALSGMLEELWKTNSRHAGMPPNSLEEAQDAVTIAVAVVALVRRGFVKPTTNP
jgi:hypothetical protein